MRFTTLLSVPLLFAGVLAAVNEVTLENVSPSRTTQLDRRSYCLDSDAIRACVQKGQAVHADCTCSNSCGCNDQHSCESNGGTYSTTSCSCTYPSGSSGGGGSPGGISWWWAQQGNSKRDLKARTSSRFCPNPYFECRVAKHSQPLGATFSVKGKQYECLDIMSDVESCGGCQSEGEGQDCSAIDHVEEVSCGEGRCIVGSCEPGWIPSSDRSGCVKDARKKGLFTSQHR